MTHLNIQQGLNIEVVSTNLIKKLYEAALSVPEPLEGELDAAYMSGNLLVGRAYRALVEYLTNRFDDLHINVTDSYYIPFEDSAVLNVLLTNNIGSDGIGVTEAEAANATFTSSTFYGNTDITSFNTFRYFTNINSTPLNCFRNCTSLKSVVLPSTCNTLNSYSFGGTSSLTSIDLSNIKTVKLLAFENSGITSINLPVIETIEQRGLSGCHNCGIVDLGPNLSSIGNLAFWDSAYTTFIFRGTTVPSFDTTNSDKFLYNMSNVTIYVPESALNDYKTAWPAMASNIVKIEGSAYDTQ